MSHEVTQDALDEADQLLDEAGALDPVRTRTQSDEFPQGAKQGQAQGHDHHGVQDGVDVQGVEAFTHGPVNAELDAALGVVSSFTRSMGDLAGRVHRMFAQLGAGHPEHQLRQGNLQKLPEPERDIG